jgi:cytochrome P450
MGTRTGVRAVGVPLVRRPGLVGLVRDPLRALQDIVADHDGAVIRLNLGLFRPYLLTDPAHVQRVLHDRPEQYVREGMLWKPLRRLEGDGIAGEGPGWRASRRVLQPTFARRQVDGLVEPMAGAIADAVAALDAPARDGLPVDVIGAMTRIVHRSLIRAFFGDRIALSDADRLGASISTAFASLGWRMLLPFVSERIPLPGDRTFRRSVRAVDEIVNPYVRGPDRRTTDAGDDILAVLAGARDAHGAPLDERRIRDDVVAMFVAGTETTALALTWVWLLLDANPPVAARLREEVEHVVGRATPGAAHLDGLTYTRMVLQETLRLYPVGWLVPRTVAEPDVVGGVSLPRGATVLVSPYLTHRLPRLWPEPATFDPERFAAGQGVRRDRFAYFPFGGGVHQCLGSHFFTVEAQLIVAGLLSRYRPTLVGSALTGPEPVAARVSATLRPRRRVAMTLAPIGRG